MTQLVLYKPELNPDVYFENPPVDFWNFGTGWTFGTNNTNGLGAEKLGVALSDLTLYTNDGYYNITTQTLLPFKDYKYKIRAEFCTNSGGGDSCQFIVGGTTIFTIPASASPVIYDGTFTTGADGQVLFRSTAGNSILLSYLKLVENPSEFEIELNDEVTVALNYAIADITDPDKRDATYSRTVRIPATKQNSKYFAHVYEITASGSFNANKKVGAEVITETVREFGGFSKLDNIERVSNGLNNYDLVAYNLTLYGNLGDMFYELGETLISELDYSEYDHEYNKTNQFNSWYKEIVRDGATYVNNVEGSFLVVSSSVNNGGRVQMNFTGAHGMSVGDWVLFPEGCLSSNGGNDPIFFYLGEHMVYEVVSSTSVVLQCPYVPQAGSITTVGSGANRVRPHYKTGEGYVYPMIDYDQNNGGDFYVNQLYPSVYAKTIIDKIFKKAKYTYDSSILDSVMFKKMITLCSGNNLKLTPDQISERLFKAKNTSDQLLTYNLSSMGAGIYAYTGSPLSAIDIQIDDDSTAPMFDNNGVFNTGTNKFVPNDSGIYSLKYSGIGRYGNTGTEAWSSDITTVVFQMEVYDYTSNTVVPNSVQQMSPGQIYQTSNQASVWFSDLQIDNLLLTAGNSYGLRYRITTHPVATFVGAGGTVQIQYGVFGGQCIFSNKIINTNLQAGDTVQLGSCLPKMKCTEYLANIIRIFNLYLTTDNQNDRKLFIETRDDFYNNGSEVVIDDLVDTSQPIVQTPMASLQGKIINYSYSEDGDFYNKDHKEKYDTVYGNNSRKIENDFKKNEYTINVSFAPTILVDMAGKIVSNMQASTETGTANDAFSGKVRLLYFNCASTIYWGWTHKTDVNDSGTNHRLYPYAGHLDKPEAPYNDLNFWFPRGVYFDYDAWTDRNLWNVYHKKTFLEQTDPESRMIELYLKINTKFISSLDFRDRFIYDGHVLRLNKINDYIAGKNIPIRCEFIKALDIPNFTPVMWQNVGVSGSGYVPEDYNWGAGKYIGQGNGDSQGGNNGVWISGSSKVGKYSYNVIVNGDGNYVGGQSSNIFITGYNNNVYPGLSNVSLINTNGVTVTESGKSYLNGQDVTNIQAKILRIST